MRSWLKAEDWHLFVPKLFIALRDGYTLADFRADVFAGATVAIVALPLSMALAIASGTPPERGLFTAVVAGFLISALGGSRHQIGGPTGAFVVVVFNVIHEFGYDGLVIATLMAGAMLILAGLLRAGTFIKYVPHPVITGFTSGIAVVIFSSQVGDLLGLSLPDGVPGDVLGKWTVYFANLHTVNGFAIAVAAGTLALILAIKRMAPNLPFLLIAVTLASLAVFLGGVDVETIGTRFGGIPRMLPAPALPQMSWDRMTELLPSAFTIFVLAGIESLLSAVVADGMTGRRHRSNCELVAQGIANMASACMGGIPATGAIARTATSIRAGARTPVAGMMHALFVLLIMVLFAPLASYIPLAALGVVLATVAWNMAEVKTFAHLLSAPLGDRLVLVTTFLLTVLVDLSIAIQVGVVMAAFLFMHRMAGAVELETHTELIKRDLDDFTEPRPAAMERSDLPPGTEAFRIDGPFFFGAATRFEEVLGRFGVHPKVIILRMSRVPLIDSTGVAALEKFVRASRGRGGVVILSGARPRVAAILDQMKLEALRAPNFPAAIKLAEELTREKT